MQIKKSHLEVLFQVLKGTENILKLGDARKRDAFLKSLDEPRKTFHEDKNKIHETFCDKNEDGTPAFIKITGGKQYHIKNEDTEAWQKEVEILDNEIIDVVPCEGLKTLIEVSEYTPKLRESEIIDSILSKI